MSRLLFLDESGHDRKESPYEVLAGICIEDVNIWRFICAIHDSEINFFGQRVSNGLLELKAKKLLKAKTFRQAMQMPPISQVERTALSRECLELGQRSQGSSEGSGASRRHITALAQAKIEFLKNLLALCKQYQIRAFASVVDRDAPYPSGNFLRRDYSFLFERYYDFLDDCPDGEMGIVVFDELERSQCHMLIEQMQFYFKETRIGIERAGRIIPEPFFVHSHLTTAIQVADIVAYIIAWGVRVGNMNRPARDNFQDLAELVLSLRYCRKVREGGQEYTKWSFAIIDDLRPRSERECQ